jgi:hypothetical protein
MTTTKQSTLLAAFYHSNDRQSLRVAALIALAQLVNMRRIREWSVREGHADRFAEFKIEVARLRKARPL